MFAYKNEIMNQVINLNKLRIPIICPFDEPILKKFFFQFLIFDRLNF